MKNLIEFQRQPPVRQTGIVIMSSDELLQLDHVTNKLSLASRGRPTPGSQQRTEPRRFLCLRGRILLFRTRGLWIICDL